MNILRNVLIISHYFKLSCYDILCFFTVHFVFDLLMTAQLSIIIPVMNLFQVFDINGLFFLDGQENCPKDQFQGSYVRRRRNCSCLVSLSVISPSIGHKGHAVTVSSQIHFHLSLPLRAIRAIVLIHCSAHACSLHNGVLEKKI